MSELEPTRTYSNPTANDILRRMLDERGVEHYDGTETTLWLKDGIGYRASADEGLNGYIHLHLWCTTPEQAIAATLGHYNAGRYVGLRQGEYWERTENGDYYCGGCGWKVTDHDSYCPECGGALHEYALGTGTCHPVISDNLTESEGTGDAWADCSECGHLLFVLTDPNSQVPNFCPNCGRRVEQ